MKKLIIVLMLFAFTATATEVKTPNIWGMKLHEELLLEYVGIALEYDQSSFRAYAFSSEEARRNQVYDPTPEFQIRRQIKRIPIMRVPGGWIYNNAVFVPYSEEFRKDKPK